MIYHNISRGAVDIPIDRPLQIPPNGDLDTEDPVIIAVCNRLVELRQLAPGPRPA